MACQRSHSIPSPLPRRVDLGNLSANNYYSIAIKSHTTLTLPCIEHEILVEPENVFAPLGTNATFNCTVRHATVLWNINGTHVKTDHQINEVMENGIFIRSSSHSEETNSSSLVVLASEQKNGTLSFACAADAGFEYTLNFSDSVYLTVFGRYQCLHVIVQVMPTSFLLFLGLL